MRKKALVKQFGWSSEDKNFRAVSFYDYPLKNPSDVGDTVAVIFCQWRHHGR